MSTRWNGGPRSHQPNHSLGTKNFAPDGGFAERFPHLCRRTIYPCTKIFSFRVLILSLLFCARSAQSAVFNIPNGDVAALKNAINVTNSNGQADVINLASNGTYTLTAADNTSSGVNGLPVINDDIAGPDLTVNGNGATILRSGNPGTPEFRILMFNTGANVGCNNLTIANGSLTGSFPANRGGGILVTPQAVLTLTNCTIRTNTAFEAGGIWNQGTLTLNGCFISLNAATRGAGIYNLEGTVMGSNCTFSQNAANGITNAPGFGGAIYNSASNQPASVTLSGCQLIANRVTGLGIGHGGALYNRQQNNAAVSFTLTNCTLSENFGEEAAGGAISNEGGSVTVTGGKLDHNYARDGGGIEQGFGSLQIRGVTFETNTAVRNTSTNTGGLGGAILLTIGGSLTVSDSIFTSNEGRNSGGAIYNAATAAITNSDFNANTAGFFGGALRNDGQLTVSGSRLLNNVSSSFGGGIFNTSNLSVERCTINGNTSGAAGGIANCGTLTLESSTLDGNRAQGSAADGGAIGMLKLNPPITTSIRNSTLSNNLAIRGAGVFNLGALSILNSTLSANIATGDGGALCNLGANSRIHASTLHGNSAARGGGIYNAMTATDAEVTYSSTIFRAGSGGTLFNLDGAMYSYGYNLSSDAAGGDATTAPGGLLNNTGDIRNTDPNLGSLQDNGGSTKTHALIFPSAAIEAGDDSLTESPSSLTTDQRGSGFPRRIGGRVDIGAFESGTVLRVTTTDDHNDGACSASDCTLREALTAANAAGPSNISFAPGVSGIIQLGGALPTIGQNLSLQGPGANRLTVRRNSGGNYRIFTISNGTSNGPSVTISGLTISNGEAPFLMSPNDSGGGILNDRGALTVSRCRLTGNRAVLTDFASGGGIFNSNGSLSVEESSITGNTSHNGGGIASSINNAAMRELVLRSSTISANTASGGAGGGLFSQAINPGSHALWRLSNCTLSGNTATMSGISGGTGGAICNAGNNAGDARFELEDCTLATNSAPSGAGIYNNNFSATAQIFLRNTLLRQGTSGGNFINSSGDIVSLGHNLCDDSAGGLGGSGPGGYLNATGDMRETDPLLGPLQDNGGLTFTHALLAGSPAINTGENSGFNPSDQRGYLRRGMNDIGAFEYNGVRLRITEIKRVGNDVVISFDAAAGLLFSLSRAASITDGAWSEIPNVYPIQPASDGVAQFTDPDAANLSRAFYRVELLVE